MTCIPKSPIQPYSPLVATIRFQLIGLFGSRSLLCQKTCLYFDNISEPPFFDPFNNPHSTWEKRKFRRASDDNVRVILNGLKDLLIRFKIDAKGLFS